ncbi:MAG: phage major capsid protein [Methanothrix sp.]|nr:phage major capsid protein [Methanothrix sp.]
MTNDTFHGVKALSMYLAYDYADNKDKHQILNSIPTREMHAYLEGDEIKTANVRELLISGSVQDTTLIQTEFYNTVMQGAEPMQCMRRFLPTINLSTGNTLSIPVSSAGAYADDVLEGQDITPKNAGYEPVTITVGKIGDAPLITDEMVADSSYGLIALEVAKSGRRVENKFNRNVLAVILGASGLQTHDTTGSNQGVAAVAEAKAKVADYNWLADKLVAHPRLGAKLLTESFPNVNYSGYNADAVRTGSIGTQILGLDYMETSVNPLATGKTWGYSSDGYYGGIVADAMNLGATVIRNDIQVENFRDPIKQIQGATTTMRFKAGIINATAGCAIIY